MEQLKFSFYDMLDETINKNGIWADKIKDKILSTDNKEKIKDQQLLFDFMKDEQKRLYGF